MNDKKEFERYYLKEFFKLLNETPENIQDSESPDFIVNIHQLEIGIEITEFHSDLKGEKGRPRRLVEEAWASLQKKIMTEVEKYEELKNMKGLLSFENVEIPRNSGQKSFIDELIQLSLEMFKTGQQKISPGINYPLLNKYLKKFCLEKVNCYITWEWNHNASFIGLSERELINTVKPKIDRAKDYLKRHVDELWLIVVSGVRLSQAMPVDLIVKLNTFNKLDRLLRGSNYKNVFLYQYQIGVIYKWPNWSKIGEEQLYPTIVA